MKFNSFFWGGVGGWGGGEEGDLGVARAFTGGFLTCT